MDAHSEAGEARSSPGTSQQWFDVGQTHSFDGCKGEAFERSQVSTIQPLPWGWADVSSAAKEGHLDVLKWKRATGCPWEQITISIAASGRGKCRHLKWARPNGCWWNVDAFYVPAKLSCFFAAEEGHMCKGLLVSTIRRLSFGRTHVPRSYQGGASRRSQVGTVQRLSMGRADVLQGCLPGASRRHHIGAVKRLTLVIRTIRCSQKTEATKTWLLRLP